MHRHEEHFPHNRGVKDIISDFKHTKLSGALTALYSNRIIQQVAGGLIGLFFPILLYEKLGYSLYKVMIYYVINWGIWMLIIPLGAMVMSKIGMKKSLIAAVCVGWLWFYFARLFAMEGALIFLGIAIIALNLDRFFYWIPYHTDFAKFTDKKTRAKQMSFLISIASLVSIFVPFIAGQIIANYGYGILFLFALLIYIMSIIPLFLIPDVRENYSFGYFETYRELFKKKNRRMVLSYGADGMQSMVGLIIWPIFIWLMLNQNYGAVGLVMSLIVLGSVLLRLVMGDFSDRYDKHKVMKWGTILNSVGWILKMFVGTGFQIFIASTYHSFANIVMRTPFDALMYERAADSGHYVDEYTVIRELALNLGRFLMIGLIILSFFLTGSLTVSFLLAGLAALVINVL
ncbi:hypothetical protein HQ571_01800 [Candidatus Kuenenbacteria bacterium]|nr:hypothetical protein [Candidatus Kuenenbacteria bacterium]